MTTRIASCTAAAASAALALASAGSASGSPAGAFRGSPPDGADVIISSLEAAQVYGQVDGVSGLSFGFNACNVGSAAASWVAGGPNHPVIAQNVYRILDGRFEHVGMSWVSHEFCALQNLQCQFSPDYPGPCVPTSGPCNAALGTGCSTPTSAASAGVQTNLSPRSQASPLTGEFAFPFAAPGAAPTIGRRLQVRTADIDPALNPGALWLAEAQVVSPDDALARNHHNNASHRRAIPGTGGASMTVTGPTHRQRPAIAGWLDADPTVTLVTMDVPGEGRFHVAAKAVNRGGGTWEYIYVVHNLNSDLACGRVSVPIGCGVQAADPGFSAPRTHSGEPYSNDPWAVTLGIGEVSWATEAEAVNPDANAIRWGTAYTFWFTTSTPPAVDPAGNFTGAVTLGLFRDSAAAVIAQGLPAPAAACRADWNGDQMVTSADITAFLTDWLAAVADANCDGLVNSADITAFLAAWLAAVGGQSC